MRQLVEFIRRISLFLASPGFVLFLVATAFAAVNNLTLTGLPPDTAVTLTKDDDPGVKAEGKASKDGTVTFDLSRFNLPPGSSVTVAAGGERKTIPSLADGSSTRDFRNPRTGAYRPPEGWSGTAQVGYGGRTTGRSGIGTYVGPDTSIVKSTNWVSGVTPIVALTGPLLGKTIDLGLSGFFGSDKNSDGEPVGGRTIGVVYDRTFAGSPGIGLGNTGANVSSKVDIAAFEAALAVPDLFFHFFDKGTGTKHIKAGPRLVFGYDQTDYRNHLQSQTFSGIFANSRREVTNTYGGPGFTLQKTHKLTDNVEFYGGINLDAIYSSGDYDGRQRTRCDLCPVGLQDARINTSDRESQWSFRPAVSAGLEYEFNSVSVGANIGYEYWSHFLVLRDRSSPSKPEPGLETQGVHRMKSGFFVKYTF